MAERLEIIVTATDKASGILSGITKKLGGIGSLAKGALFGGLALGVGAAGAAFGALGATLKSSFAEAAAAEEVTAQLQAVLKSTGGAAGVTEKQINNYANSMSQLTKYEDDAIVAAQSMLLTFTNVGSGVFDDASTAILNVSAAMGTDLQGSAIQVGKALNDPIKGISALSRVGVTFTEDQKKMIEEMVKAGDVMGAQKMILAELNKEFGGSATAAGATFNGQMEILKNTIGNVKEEIGMALMPVLREFAAKYLPVVLEGIKQFAQYTITTVIPAVAKLAEWFGDKFLPAIIKAGEWIAAVLAPAFKELTPIINTIKWTIMALVEKFKGDFAPAAGIISDVIGRIVSIFKELLFLFTTPIIYDFETLITGYSALFQEMGFTEEQAESMYKVLRDLGRFYLDTLYPAIVKLAGSIKEILITAITALKSAWENNFLGIRDVVAGLFTHIQLLFKMFKQAFEGDWRGVGETMRQMWDNLVDTVKKVDWKELGKNVVRGIVAGIVALGTWLGESLLGIVNAAVEMIKGFLGINSPSKLMADQVGKQMALGIGAGLQSGLRNLAASATANIAPVVQSFSAPFASVPAYAMAGAGGGGATVVVHYSPMVSFADEYELEHRLKPMIERAMRRR